MKILIFGITGQDGSYLAEELLKLNHDVYGVIRKSSSFNTKRIDKIFNKLKLFYGDVTDSLSIDNIIHKVKPDRIYNLSAQSHVAVSFEIPDYTTQVDAIGTLRILEAMRKHVPNCRFYQASTSELYGDVLEIPQKETTPFNPQSPYAIAKQYSYWIVKNYRQSYNLFASNGILFNHESERRLETFVTRKITKTLTNILFDDNITLELGNIYSKRDWGYAPDYVKGMIKILEYEKADDFVLSTNETHTIKEFINETINVINNNITYTMSFDVEWRGTGLNETLYCKNRKRNIIKINKKYFRPADVNLLLGDYSKAEKLLNWKPETTFNKLVEKMVLHDLKNKYK